MLQKNIKVNFLIAGAQKAGTTALYTYLRQHPQIYMPERKELHFFDKDRFFRNNTIIDYQQYHQYFQPNSGHRIIGEATPIYMYWSPVMQRIWQYNPDMKLILILRNPLERAFSHWYMEKIRKTETLSFMDAIKRERELPYQHRFYSYISRGFYTKQIERIWQFFPREQTYFLKTEDLKNNAGEMLRGIYHFLKVDILEQVSLITMQPSSYAYLPNNEELSFLRQIFEAEIRALEKLLVWDCHNWLRAY